MRGITFAMFATLLLVTSGMIGSGQTALAHNSKVIGTFSNSGNYQETQQSCGNSCTLSSSNVITQGQGGASTTPSPIPPVGTVLTLTVRNVTNGLSLRASLAFSASNVRQLVTAPVGGLTITFTGTGVPPNLAAMVQEGNLAIFSVTIKPPTAPGTYTFQAHFAGATFILNGGGTLQLLKSDSEIVRFTVP
jgi:hypothetical protein